MSLADFVQVPENTGQCEQGGGGIGSDVNHSATPTRAAAFFTLGTVTTSGRVTIFGNVPGDWVTSVGRAVQRTRYRLGYGPLGASSPWPAV
jgi:hypothetical protein